MEPTVSSETLAIRTQTPGNYPKRNKLCLEHGESLKTRFLKYPFAYFFLFLCSLHFPQVSVLLCVWRIRDTIAPTIKLQDARPTAKHEAISPLVDQLDLLCDAPDTHTSIPPSARQLLCTIASLFCLKVTRTMGFTKTRIYCLTDEFNIWYCLEIADEEGDSGQKRPW